MELSLKEKVTKEKTRKGNLIREAVKKYEGTTPEGVEVKLILKGKEQELAPYGDMVNWDIADDNLN